ncbi:MAG: radical SAM protein [Candidatus Thermoplasmatota archaeon]|nr:radical SAM protein [Candidatus Thermoplasmatota archaeon]
MTGKACALSCKHCAGRYLEGMIPAPSPEDLLAVAEALAERGANGFLLSGGSDSTGKVELAPFCEAIKEVKATTDLKINAHIGLSSTEEIKRLVGSGIDSFSVDVYGSDETVREVLGLEVSSERYFRVVEDLRDAGADVIAPHICVGIHGGEMRGELKAVSRLASLAPEVLVLISLIPTKGTEYEGVPTPSDESMLSVIRSARKELPGTKVVLGCMRSKLRRHSEVALVRAGLDGIVLPAPSTVHALQSEGFTPKKRSVCCSMI